MKIVRVHKSIAKCKYRQLKEKGRGDSWVRLTLCNNKDAWKDYRWGGSTLCPFHGGMNCETCDYWEEKAVG